MRSFVKLLTIVTMMVMSAAACSDVFKKDDNSKPSLKFFSSAINNQNTIFNGDTLIFHPLNPSNPYPEKNPPFISGVENKQIKIKGYFMSGCVNWGPVGEISINNKQIQIYIQPDKEKDCANMPSGFIYEAFISELSKGKHKVRIVHKADILRSFNGKNDTVFTQEFVIE